MRKFTALLLTICLLHPLMLVGVRAQSAAGLIDQLRASIAALEKLERNGTTSSEVAELNRQFLTSKRRQLHDALLRRQRALAEYVLVAGASLSDSEVQAVRRALADVGRELRALEELLTGTDGARAEAAGPAPVRGADAAAESRNAPRPNAPAAEAAAEVVPAGWGGRLAVATEVVESALQDGVAHSCPSCLPSPPLDEAKDFIFNARTGEARGKTRFGRSERARIIITDKNPFLYEYRVTLKNIPIAEPAIAAFFGRFPLFADEVKAKAESGERAETAAPSCPTLNIVTQVEAQLSQEESSTNANSLRNFYLTQKRTYDATAAQFKQAQDVLYSPNTSCPVLCTTATNIRTVLQSYQPPLQQLSERIAEFKANATFLRARVNSLQQGPALPGACADELDRLRRLSIAYVAIAEDFEKGLTTITNGKKTFDAAVKSINDVFANPNAFYQVYTRGPFGTPTDVEITVERRNLREDGATFAKVGETETVNFGGGPRFALSGGVVAAPFETVTYKRVPAIVDGRTTTIIGTENGSNSRILPILMLHGRIFDTPRLGFINGVHLSLGITAKPNDEGTNVEYLVGPSVSFIEERLFFTVGGYAGRRQQLEGNLAPGQELPKEFTEDIPVNNRLTWKPGFALTYKFK